MTDIRIPTRDEIKARKARLWDRAHAASKIDATSLYRVAYSSEDEVPFLPLISCQFDVGATPAAKTFSILRQITQETGVSIDMMRSESRHPVITDARKRAYYELASRRPELSWPDIGRIMRKHHTTVIAGVRSFARAKGLPEISKALPTPPSKAEAA